MHAVDVRLHVIDQGVEHERADTAVVAVMLAQLQHASLDTTQSSAHLILVSVAPVPLGTITTLRIHAALTVTMTDPTVTALAMDSLRQCRSSSTVPSSTSRSQTGLA